MSLYTKKNGYIYESINLLKEDEFEDYNGNIHSPQDIDSEFQSQHPLTDSTAGKQPRKGLTIQCKAIDHTKGEIFAHPDTADKARHPVFKDFAPITYLKSLGHDISIEWLGSEYQENLKKLPAFHFDLYAFFIVAEIGMIATGNFKKDLIAACRKKDSQSRIEQKRRTRAVTPLHKFGEKDYIDLNWLITYKGKKYRARISLIDTCAVHGVANYKGFCSATGIKLSSKDNFTNEEKSRMEEMYIERPDDFDSYALGDLHNYEALKANLENFKIIYERLAIAEYFQAPRFTIGATVRDMYQASVASLFGIPNDRKQIRALIKLICEPANAKHLKEQINSTLALNAKVRGGRCRNNKPIITNHRGTLVDVDISGCYGEGQRNQIMPFGNPVTISYPWNTAKNKYQTLREFIKKYGKELVAGCWQAIGSTQEPLKHRQDFIVSWIPPEPFKSLATMPTDTDYQELDGVLDWLDKNAGNAKIYNHEIKCGLITSDTLEWITNVCSAAQRKELLDKIYIDTAILYPASERVSSPDELLEKLQSHHAENTCDAHIKKGKSKVVSIARECHAWYGVNMGDLIINQLLKARKEHPKKTPLNTLFKLCINTLYGDMVSPYFDESNVVVGNNITARARALAWYMEKGLDGWQSITDGCVIDLNNVVYPKGKARVTAENVTNLYRARIPSDNHVVKKPLAGAGKIEFLDWECIDGEWKPTLKLDENIIPAKDTHAWIDNATWKHLQQIFPNISILHKKTDNVYGKPVEGMFVFETKACYTQATFHGTANYMLINPNSKVVKMRSYEKDKQERYTFDKNRELILDENTTLQPSYEFMEALANNPFALKRSIPFLKPGILKCGEYRNNYESRYKNTNLIPGDTIYKSGMIREFSFSQFTFQTIAQAESWQREFERFKRLYGQSYEMFFTDDRLILNYQEMIVTIDEMIAAGKPCFIEEKDVNRNKARKYNQHTHPHLESLETLKKRVNKAYELKDYDDISDEEWELGEDWQGVPESYSEYLGGTCELEDDDYSFLDALDI